MKRFLLLFSISTLLICLLSTIFPIVDAISDAKSIYSGVIRLHVLANSDSDVDQANKLSVRDALVEQIASLTDGCTDRASAETLLNQNLDALTMIATDTLTELGASDTVKLTLSEEYYPTRQYDELSLPAGRYLSLRVIIGEGEGHNWWCVLFPPVCMSSARADEELAEVGFTPNQVRMLTDDEDVHYVFKFRVIELASELGERFRELFGNR